MKRFTVFYALLSIVAFGAAFQTWLASKSSAEAVYDNAPIPVYDATGAMLKAINAGNSVESSERIAPVYDATGAMLAALNTNKKVVTLPAYDATGAMLAAIYPKPAEVKIVPVYDATGAMLDAIQP